MVTHNLTPEHPCFRVCYALMKVRGPKIVTRYLSTDVSLLEPAFAYFCDHDETVGSWQCKYVTLIWLSVFVTVPLPLKSIAPLGFLRELIDRGLSLLNAAGAERDAAALMLSKLMSRSDSTAILSDVMKQLVEMLNAPKSVFELLGSLRLVALLLISADKSTMLSSLD